MVSRADIPAVARRTEEVPCAPFGGSVRVRAMDLVQLLAFNEKRKAAQERIEGESAAEHDARVMDLLMPFVLGMCVVTDDDGEPVYTEDEWRIWCAQNIAEGYELFAAATKVGSAEAQKKT